MCVPGLGLLAREVSPVALRERVVAPVTARAIPVWDVIQAAYILVLLLLLGALPGARVPFARCFLGAGDRLFMVRTR
jgi:hypothetical protein